ncbi:MAG: hypothetical protein K6G56_01565 [Clostridiales bacterium]|nr:hypothetical protein [Clostridiales bacterium]
MRIWQGHQKGVNLGGRFSQCVHTEEHYDSFITEADFPEIKSRGADHVRVPVDYELLEDENAAPRESGYRPRRMELPQNGFRPFRRTDGRGSRGAREASLNGASPLLAIFVRLGYNKGMKQEKG